MYILLNQPVTAPPTVVDTAVEVVGNRSSPYRHFNCQSLSSQKNPKWISISAMPPSDYLPPPPFTPLAPPSSAIADPPASSLASRPFSPQKAKYYRELEAAVDVVHRACHICVDVQKSLFSDDGRVLEKNDSTPVTIADFSVQALISLELGKLFPLIPLVAEEDSAFLRVNNLADSVVKIVNDKTSFTHEKLTDDEVLEAIDRGGNNAVVFEAKPATYWVGLALVVDGEIVVGVMGCPNWQENSSNEFPIDARESQKLEPQSGIIMAAHVGCGTWMTRFSGLVNGVMNIGSFWERCFVSGCSLVQEAYFCIPDSQTWDSLPLSDSFSATTRAASVGDRQILLLPSCCGRYAEISCGKMGL
ncbi:hypothetical protein Cgig2_024248 [Carnegiea gigantea]|uniref:PAP-specific phosphatase, mitochondrial n=1 Tax=Carnegiea gigantea TaxID=171969 RepID=A0A9Q1QAR8_9CARY|nr:hypothetical protein Cgig2_024248 [Carnegiea gigantea]